MSNVNWGVVAAISRLGFFVYIVLCPVRMTTRRPGAWRGGGGGGGEELRDDRLHCRPLLPSEREWIGSCSSPRRGSSSSSLVEPVRSLVVVALEGGPGLKTEGSVRSPPARGFLRAVASVHCCAEDCLAVKAVKALYLYVSGRSSGVGRYTNVQVNRHSPAYS